MPEATYSHIIRAPLETVWDFISEIDNWAPLVTGYQSHQLHSDTQSSWRLKGELGGLSRIAEFNVLVTEWREPEVVTFELEGLNEPVRATGSFKATALQGNTGEPEHKDSDVSIWSRIMRKIGLRIIVRSSDVTPSFPPAMIRAEPLCCA